MYSTRSLNTVKKRTVQIVRCFQGFVSIYSSSGFDKVLGKNDNCPGDLDSVEHCQDVMRYQHLLKLEHYTCNPSSRRYLSYQGETLGYTHTNE